MSSGLQGTPTRAPKGARHAGKRVGRGDGSGHGSFSGRGMKGQNSRSGGGVRPGFEGGQLSVIKRLPGMRGFKNPFRREYTIVNLSSLGGLRADTHVTPEMLVERGVVKNAKRPIKVLGRGDLEVSLTVEAHKFSKSAQEKIEASGGSVRVIG